MNNHEHFDNIALRLEFYNKVCKYRNYLDIKTFFCFFIFLSKTIPAYHIDTQLKDNIFRKKFPETFDGIGKIPIFAAANHNRGEVGEWLKPTVC